MNQMRNRYNEKKTLYCGEDIGSSSTQLGQCVYLQRGGRLTNSEIFFHECQEIVNIYLDIMEG